MDPLILEVGLALVLIAAVALLAGRLGFSVVPFLVVVGMAVGPHLPTFGPLDLGFEESAEYPGEGRGAWVELPADPVRAGEICVGGEREAKSNPGLAEMLGALDEAEERLGRGTLGEAC